MTRRGSALATVLVAGLVLFILLKALIVISHGNAFSSRAYQDRVAAGYVLEAGVADAMAMLGADADWNAGFTEQPMTHGPGNYTVRFAPAATVPGPTDSVNNLKGLTTVDGPRGPNTIPAGSAEIVVTARVGMATRRVHVFLTGTSNGALSGGILASNRILMSGNLDIKGITDLGTGQTIDAELHANKPGQIDNVVTWDGTGVASILGRVSTRSDAAGAINLNGATPSAGALINAGDKPPPTLDIVSEVSARSVGYPDPGLNPTGLSKVGPGEYYLKGPVVINGDVNLDGAKIYVSGDVTINGSLSGSGELFVSGKTSLKGDTTLTGADGVALFSRGSVELSGFDGTAYLSAVIGGDPTAQADYAQMTQALSDINTLFATNPSCDIFDNGPAHAALDDALNELGGWDSADDGAAQRLADRIESTQPPSPSRDFMVSKIRDVARFGSETKGDPFQHWHQGDHRHDGIMIEASHNDEQLMVEIATAMREFNVNKMGSTYFQGSIYTDGYLYANSDVTVVGAVIATGTNTGETGLVDGMLVEAGDIVLRQGVNLTLNQETIDKFGGATTTGTLTMQLKSWIEM